MLVVLSSSADEALSVRLIDGKMERGHTTNIWQPIERHVDGRKEPRLTSSDELGGVTLATVTESPTCRRSVVRETTTAETMPDLRDAIWRSTSEHHCMVTRNIPSLPVRVPPATSTFSLSVGRSFVRSVPNRAITDSLSTFLTNYASPPRHLINHSAQPPSGDQSDHPERRPVRRP